MWVGRRAPLQLLSLIFPERKASGTSSQRPPPALVCPEAPQSSLGARAPWGRLWASRGQDAGGSPGSGQSAAARLAPRPGRAAPRSARRALGGGVPRWGGARRAAAPSARPDRGGASRRGAWRPRGCARVSLGTHSPRSALPGLGGLGPRQTAAVCAALAPGCVQRRAGAARWGHSTPSPPLLGASGVSWRPTRPDAALL